MGGPQRRAKVALLKAPPARTVSLKTSIVDGWVGRLLPMGRWANPYSFYIRWADLHVA